jgi:hypothetical protein
MFRLITVVLLLACANCGPSNPVNRPTPDPEDCASACSNLKRLGCPEGQDIFTPDQDAGQDAGSTISCTAWCEYTQKQGHALNASCVTKITACDQISNCDW